MASASPLTGHAAEDHIANQVLQHCSQDIMSYININEVKMPMYSKGWLTLEELNHLNNISTTEQEKKEQFYLKALANKGSGAFNDFIEILRERPGNYVPHNDLVEILTQSHACHSRPAYRRTVMREPPEQAPEAKIQRTDMTSASSETNLQMSSDTSTTPEVTSEEPAESNRASETETTLHSGESDIDPSPETTNSVSCVTFVFVVATFFLFQ